MRAVVLIIFCFLSINAVSQTDEELARKAKKKCSFEINQIESTDGFYIYTATNKKNEKVKLVVDKESKQLRRKQIQVGKTYKFKTYSYFDIVHPSSILCHKVQRVKIWCYKDKIDLRFTDSMGDITYMN